MKKLLTLLITSAAMIAPSQDFIVPLPMDADTRQVPSAFQNFWTNSAPVIEGVLSVSNLQGGILDSQLSGNVPLLDQDNSFTGSNFFGGKVTLSEDYTLGESVADNGLVSGSLTFQSTPTSTHLNTSGSQALAIGADLYVGYFFGTYDAVISGKITSGKTGNKLGGLINDYTIIPKLQVGTLSDLGETEIYALHSLANAHATKGAIKADGGSTGQGVKGASMYLNAVRAHQQFASETRTNDGPNGINATLAVFREPDAGRYTVAPLVHIETSDTNALSGDLIRAVNQTLGSSFTVGNEGDVSTTGDLVVSGSANVTNSLRADGGVYGGATADQVYIGRASIPLYSGLWLRDAAPHTVSDYTFLSDGTSTFVNAPSGTVYFRINNITRWQYSATAIGMNLPTTVNDKLKADQVEFPHLVLMLSTNYVFDAGTSYSNFTAYSSTALTADYFEASTGGEYDYVGQNGAVFGVTITTSMSGAANSVLNGAIFVNNVEQTGLEWTRKIGGGGDQGSASATGFLTLNDGDTVGYRIKSDGTADPTFLQVGIRIGTP